LNRNKYLNKIKNTNIKIEDVSFIGTFLCILYISIESVSIKLIIERHKIEKNYYHFFGNSKKILNR